jgi:hypothetical protein
MVVTANVILLIQPALAVSIQIALSWQKWVAHMQVVNGVDPTLRVMPTPAVHHVPGMLTVAVQSMSPISWQLSPHGEPTTPTPTLTVMAL